MVCNYCSAESKSFTGTQETLAHVKEEGWKNHIFFEKQLAIELWKCPTCIELQNKFNSEPQTIVEVPDGLLATEQIHLPLIKNES